MWKKFKRLIVKHKTYLLGLASVLVGTLLFVALFWNKSITLVEGWYNLYAQFILQEGLVPYKDFPLIVPPIALGLWTVVQAVFGNTLVVFRVMDIGVKLVLGGSFYHLFTRFYSEKIAVLGALIVNFIFISSIFDNGVPSYNIYAIILCIWLIIAGRAFLKQLFVKNTISNGALWGIGTLFALSFLNKQTSGPLTIIAVCAVLHLAVWRQKGFKEMCKVFLKLLASSLVVVGLVWIALAAWGCLPDYLNQIFFSSEAKGSLENIFLKRIVEIFVSYEFVRALLLGGIISFTIQVLVSNKIVRLYKKPSFMMNNKRMGLFVGSVLGGILAAIGCAWIKTVHSVQVGHFHLSSYSSNLNAFIIAGLCLFVFLCLYSALMALFVKKRNYRVYAELLLYISFLAMAYSAVLSYGFPVSYPYVLAIVFCFLFKQRIQWNWTKDIVLLGFAGLVAFFCVSMKLESPSFFHGWRAGSVVQSLEKSFIPALRGLKIPVEEKKMLEDIYTDVQRYTNPSDPILAFNNNQLFYLLLNRPPYTRYISYYYDVSPDSESLQTIEKMKRGPLPKAIVYLRFSEASRHFHEQIFRGGQRSGQHQLDEYIQQLIDSGVYTVIRRYDKKVGQNGKWENFFLEDGFSLQLLIQTALLPKETKPQRTI